VSLKETTYAVEVEMKKLMAIVQVDAKTHGIKSYEIQPKGEEASSASFSPKIIIIMLGVSAAVYVGLYFAFKIFGL
jgi:phage anti-repressor protein